jgi:hypothetical protein
MKNYSSRLTIFLFLVFNNFLIAQNCSNSQKVPKEFYRSGYYESNMNAGFPYGAAFYATKEVYTIFFTLPIRYQTHTQLFLLTLALYFLWSSFPPLME